MKAPFDMPTHCVARQEFELQRDDYTAPEASGRIGGVQAGFPLWAGSWTLAPMATAKSDELRGFFSKARGATRRFLGWDQQRPYPTAYPTGFAGLTRAGGGSFDGTATSWSETITADGDSQITLHGYPVGFVLGTGDYIGFSWTATETAIAGLTWHAPVRVLVGATADGSGVVTVTSEPPLPTAVPGSATAYLNTPRCVMVLVASQSSLQAIDTLGIVPGGQIVGIQDIRS